MTVPAEYDFASREFSRFLAEARDAAGLVTTNQSYTMVEGVLRAFRRRLSVTDAIRFAGVLPPMLRALFVADWDTSEPVRPFADRAAMTRDVQALRPGHNFAPDTAIADVARVLRQHVDPRAFDDVLAELPEGARQFWSAEK